MANEEHVDAWERVAALLARELPIEELRVELEQDGIHVDRGIEDLRRLVRRTYQQAARDRSIREMRESAGVREQALQEVSSWSFAKICEWLEKAAAGQFGPDVAELTLAYHRNKQARDLTEVEARSLIADIFAAKKVSLQETLCRSRARELLRNFMVGAPDEIDLVTIAWDTGRLTIEIGNLDTAEGRLVASAAGGCIRINEAVHNEARRRFIVGHELGHFCLHKATAALDRAAELADWRVGSRETEANIFSGELLMPDFLFNPLLENQEPSLQLVDTLASRFATSALATGVQYATYTVEPVAVVVCRNEQVLWCRKSQSFEFWIADTLHPYSAAHEILSGKSGDTKKMVKVPALAWLPQFEGSDEAEIMEDARYVEAYDIIVSLLWIEECI